MLVFQELEILAFKYKTLLKLLYLFFYFFFKYGRPVLLLTPTVMLAGLSQGVPLFGVFLLKK